MELKLPESIASKRDITRLLRAMEAYSEQALQRRVSLKSAGSQRPEPAMPRSLGELLEFNSLDNSEGSFKELGAELTRVKDESPVVRVAFSSYPDDDVLRKIVGWFRREIQSDLLVQVGVQPMIAGGCVVQTGPNRYDFSIRSKLLGSTKEFLGVMQRVK